MIMEIENNYEVAITTFDNPFDPFDQFEEWLLFDSEKGYNTSGVLDRLTNITDDMTEIEERTEIERGIDRMIELDFMNIYKKVVRKSEEESGEEDEN